MLNTEKAQKLINDNFENHNDFSRLTGVHRGQVKSFLDEGKFGGVKLAAAVLGVAKSLGKDVDEYLDIPVFSMESKSGCIHETTDS